MTTKPDLRANATAIGKRHAAEVAIAIALTLSACAQGSQSFEGVSASASSSDGPEQPGDLDDAAGTSTSEATSSPTTQTAGDSTSDGDECELAQPNACGGCGALGGRPGGECSNEAGCLGTYLCDGLDAVRCDAEPTCGGPSTGALLFAGVDFDDGTLGVFGPSNDDVAVVDVGLDGIGCYSGGCVRLNHNGEVPWNDTYATSQIDSPEWSTNEEMLLRWRLRIDADHDALLGQAGNKSSRLLGQGIDNSIIYADPNGFLLATGSQFTDSAYIPYLYRPLDTDWHEIAYYYRLDDGEQPNGRMRIWWDGELVGDYDGHFTRHETATSQYVTFPSNWSTNDNPDWAHDANNHMYIDDVRVFYDGDLGTPTSGTMFDNTITPV